MSGILAVAGKAAAPLDEFAGSGGDLMDRFELRAPIEVDKSLSPFKEGLECFLLNRPMIRSVGYLPLYRL